MSHENMRHFSLKIGIFFGLFLGFLFVSVGLARESADRFFDELWYLERIMATEAWETQSGSSETIVAVLDAGFDLDHEDLFEKYWRNTEEIAGDGIDNDGNGFEDDVTGWDFVDSDSDPSPDIVSGGSDTVASHGTVIAGVIGAQANNGQGIVGVNWDVSIMPLRVLDENGSGSTTNVRRAIRYAVENGADVINLSVTFSQTDVLLRETIEWAHEQGVVIVAAAGNGNIDTDVTPIYPACFDVELGRNVVIGVSATNKQDQKADFSNFGTSCVDLAAPGTNIFGAVYHDPSELLFVTAYGTPWEGTSLAAPMVSGAAALLRSAYPSLTPDQVRNVLKLSVDSVAESSLEARKRLGSGRLNIERALEYADVFVNGSGMSSRIQRNTRSDSFVIAQARGSEPVVRRMDGHGSVVEEFYAYDEQFHGGVRLSVGDVDGDGEIEIVTGAGPSGGPQVRVFDQEGNVESQFFAFDTGDRNGIFVSTGDTNGDGIDEILVTNTIGGTGQVRIFNKSGHLKGSFFPFGRTEYSVRVVAGNFDEDQALEIASYYPNGEDNSVVIHDGDGRYVRQLNAEGVSIAVGDLENDGIDELFVGARPGHVPRVWVYNAFGKQLASFLPFQLDFRGGVEVAAGDIDGNGEVELYATAHTSGGPQVRIFTNVSGLVGTFFAFDIANRFGSFIAF